MQYTEMLKINMAIIMINLKIVWKSGSDTEIQILK